MAAAAGGDLWAAKAAALHHFRNSDFERALALMMSVAEREGTPENVKNVAVALRSLGRAQEAVEWMESRKAEFDAIEYHDVLCSLLAVELPKRRAVLESRLRRIEQFAEDADTRTAAERLRRRVSGRPDLPSAPNEAT